MVVAALALGVVLSWSAPEGCPDERALVDDIEALLGRSLSEPFARWVDVHAIVRRRAGMLSLEISGDGSGGPFSRTLEDASCDALADAAALIIALAIDPSALEPPPPAPPPPPPPPTEPPPPIEPVETATPTETAPLPFGLPWPRVGLSVLGAYQAGVRPSAGPGVSIAGAIFWRYLRLEGIVGYWFERSARIAAQPSSGADVSLIAAGGRACPTYPWPLEVSFCLGIELGQLRADPVGLPGEPAGRSLWGAAVGSIGIAWAPVEFLALRLSGEGFWSVFRPSYEVAGLGEIHKPSRFGGRGLAGIEVRFF